MTGKPLILVTNDSNSADDGTREIRSPSSYTRAVALAGGVPFISGEQCPRELAELADGLVLTGGPDIDPQLFGEAVLNDTVKTDPPRQQFELALLDAWLTTGKPMLCICRGFQLVNCVLGGSLWQDLVEQKNLVHYDPQLRHPVRAAAGSLLHTLFGRDFHVNSTHHQAIKTLGKGLRATAWSENGDLIEAYEHESLPILGVQWHPERLTNLLWDERTPEFAPFFRCFMDLVKKHHAR